MNLRAEYSVFGFIKCQNVDSKRDRQDVLILKELNIHLGKGDDKNQKKTKPCSALGSVKCRMKFGQGTW